MKCEWKKYSVQDLIDLSMIEEPKDGNHGNNHPKTSDYVPFGVPFIMANDLVNGKVDYTNCAFISEEQANTLKKGFAHPGDVLITHKATIGRTAIVDKTFDTIILTPQVTYYRVIKGISNLYLKYYFDSSVFQQIFANWAGAGSTRAYLGITAQKKLPIVLPPIETQNKIASILSSIDDKIELNNAINNNLEQQAQAVYQEWFVSKVNDYPDNYRKVSLADLMDYAGGSQPPASEFISTEKKGYIRFVQIRDYDSDSHLTYIPVSKKNKLCSEHDIMIARYGASLGRICFGINGAYNVALAKVFPKNTYFREFLRCYLSSRTFYEGINNKGGRSAQAGFNQSDIKSFEIQIPRDETIVKNFERTVSPMFEQRLQLKKENQYLSALRDALLPKLMSGELHVSDIEL